MAVDPKLVNESLLQGVMTQPILPCPPFKPGDAECGEGVWPKYDLVKAKALVKQYTDEKGPLGTYSLLLNSAKRDVAEFTQQILRDIGINVNITLLPVPEYVTRFIAGDATSG